MLNFLKQSHLFRRIFVFWTVILLFASQKGWTQNETLLKQFEGSRITTIVNSTSVSGTDESGNAQKVIQGGIPTSFSKTSKSDSREYEVSIRANGRKGWRVNLTIPKIKVIVDSEGQKSVYDSDNIFERDPMANAMGNRFDPLVNKIFKIDYDVLGDVISKEEVNAVFKKFWMGRCPVFYTPELWQAKVFFSKLADVSISLNFSWKDSSSTEVQFYITQYTITNITDGKVTLSFEGSIKPLNPPNSSLPQGTITEKGDKYKGEMIVDRKTYLILKTSLTMVSELTYKYGSSSAPIITTSEYEITNTVSDLKK